MNKLDIIKRNALEIVTEEELAKLLKEKKDPSVYLGTAITGAPHVGYFAWIIKMADFLKAGFKVKLLLADMHGALDNTPWDVLDKRFNYYEKVIPLMFKAIGSDISNFEIIKGSDFELKRDYMLDVLKYTTVVSINDAKRAGSDVVKKSENPRLSGLLYPIFQSLDEVYLGVDMQYGGVDQRKIFMFSRENLPKLGYKRRIEFMTPLIPGLAGKKMSASDKESKIDLLDDEKTVNEKINSAHCIAGEIEENGILAFAKYVILVLKGDKNEQFIIKRPEKFGGDLVYLNYTDLEKDFIEKKLHPMDLKSAVAKEINILLTPFRDNFKELKNLSKEAYS